MASLGETKLVSTGDEDTDGYLTISFVLLVIVLVLDVAHTFWTAYNNASSTRTTRGAVFHKREICMFLLLAVVGLFIVNAIKFQYMQIKFASLEEIQDSFTFLKQKVHIENKSWVARHNLKKKSLIADTRVPARYLHPDMYVDEVREQITKAVQKLSEHGQEITGKLKHSIARSYHQFHEKKGVENIWDNFKTLVATQRRFWWTQQWFMGYAAWASFVAIECYHRAIRSSAVLSFTLLAYIFGLSGVQCLFFALLLLQPRIARRRPWMPQRAFTLLTYGAEAVVVVVLNFALHKQYILERGWIYNALQASVILLPPLSQRCVCVWPHVLMRNTGNGRNAKRSLVWVYFIASFHMAAAVHVYATLGACEEGGPGKRVRWPIGMAWTRPESTGMKLTGIVRSLINALGDHDWISAVGADVLLSVFALCCWAVVGNADARSMIKCGIFPWLDEARDAIGAATHHVRDAAEDTYEDTVERLGSTLSTARSKARQTSQELRHRATQWAGLEDEDEDEDMEQQQSLRRLTKGERGRQAKSTTRDTQARSPGSTRSRSRTRASVSTKKTNTLRQSSRVRDASRPRQRSEFEEDDDGPRVLISTAALAGPAEAAAVTLSLWVLGGLGMCSSALFGAGELE